MYQKILDIGCEDDYTLIEGLQKSFDLRLLLDASAWEWCLNDS